MVLIPFFTIIILFYLYQIRNKNIFGPISLLFLTYVAMFFASFILELSPFNIFHYSYNFYAMTFLSICFIVMFSGFMFYRDYKIIAINIENPLLFRMLSIFLIVGGFLSFAFFAPFAYTALSGNININRMLVASGSEGTLNLGGYGLINSFCSLFANLFVLNLLCAFISITNFYSKNNRLIFLLLVSSSLSYVIHVLAYVGRDGMVYWFMTYIIIFLLFKRHISSVNKKIALRIIFVSGPLLFIPFLAISISRFFSEKWVAWWLIDYMGQQLRNFNDRFLIDCPIEYGMHSFPVFMDFLKTLGLHIPVIEKETMWSFYFYNGILPNVFRTFIGSFLSDFGKIGTVVILLLMSLVTFFVLRKASRIGILDFSNLLIFVLFLQIPYWGVFYFRQYSTNYYLIAMILISFVFKAFRISRVH